MTTGEDELLVTSADIELAGRSAALIHQRLGGEEGDELGAGGGGLEVF